MTLPSITISSVTTCRFALRNAFVIARGSKTEAITVVVHVTDGQHTGRGEAVPYARFGESVEATVATLNQLAAQPLRDPAHAVASLPAGAARNALDCALWDLRAKTTGEGIASRLEMGILQPVQTFFTLSLDTPANMAAQAQQWPGLSAFKLKLGCGDAETDLACLRSVRTARPSARLIVDANEAWHANQLEELLRGAAELGVELIEQPLPERDDTALGSFKAAFPGICLCADESVHTRRDIATLAQRYDAINIKLDKAGGLSEALAMLDVARTCGLKVMIGSMVASSLAIAPACVLAQTADWVDLDSPLLLADDVPDALEIDKGGLISPPRPALWG